MTPRVGDSTSNSPSCWSHVELIPEPLPPKMQLPIYKNFLKGIKVSIIIIILQMKTNDTIATCSTCNSQDLFI